MYDNEESRTNTVRIFLADSLSQPKYSFGKIIDVNHHVKRFFKYLFDVRHRSFARVVVECSFEMI